jgi:peptidoglycan/xylan/chitin deacetylase (PgdA/CDA1 family)
VLRSFKLTALGWLRGFRVFELAARSKWRNDRLLILCYHGISIRDEHLWSPGLFMSPDDFNDRLERIRAGGYTVLPLAEGVQRLEARDLPPRSVAITFDDGLFDFHNKAWPLLERFGFPATVYVTTFYSEYNRPVFRLICDYMMWRQRGRVVTPGLIGEMLDLRTAESRARELLALDAYVALNKIGASAKDQLASDLALLLGEDWNAICADRLLNIMSPGQVAELAAQGVDIQLHTHRHRTPDDQVLFTRELHDNAKSLIGMTGRQPQHFCYPSGVHYARYPGWLREAGIRSATTCEAGLATFRTDAMLLPRLCDHSGVTTVEFEGWMCGLLDWLPKRQ